jgi:hypothetical protein
MPDLVLFLFLCFHQLAAVLAYCRAVHSKEDPQRSSGDSAAPSGYELALLLTRYISIDNKVLLRFSQIEPLSLLPAYQMDFACRPAPPPGEGEPSADDFSSRSSSFAADVSPESFTAAVPGSIAAGAELQFAVGR